MRKKSSSIFYRKDHRSKTYRKKIKRYYKELRARNKRLINKYPWLAPISWRTGKRIENKRYDYISLWDEIPQGWINTFGHLMCDEIEEELEKNGAEHKVYVEQAKEKYGGLRLYMATPGKVDRIISKYERISENVCIRCGKPHVPMMNFCWISPYCSDCFYKLQKQDEYFYQGEYEKYAPENKDHWRIPEVLRWSRYSKETGEIVETEDISETVKKIERIWNEKHPDNQV